MDKSEDRQSLSDSIGQNVSWDALLASISDNNRQGGTGNGGRGNSSNTEQAPDRSETAKQTDSYLPTLNLEDRTERESEKPLATGSDQAPNYHPSQALDLFNKYAAPDEKPLLKEWLKEGLSTAVHESVHLLSKDEHGGYLLPDGTRKPRIDADKEFGRDNYLPTPKSTINGIPPIQGMTDTYLNGKEAASSATDFGFWLDELNAYNSETLLHQEKGGKDVNVNFTGVTMFGAGLMQYMNKLSPQQSSKLVSEHGDTLRKMWKTTEDAMAYGASQGFPTEASNYFNSFFSSLDNRRAMEKLMGRPLRIPQRFD